MNAKVVEHAAGRVLKQGDQNPGTPENPITVDVSVAFVGTGGNTIDGTYQYTCVPDVVHVTKPGAVIQYKLSAQTIDSLQITGLFTSDSFYTPQITLQTKFGPLGTRYANIAHKNEKATLINVALQITDLAVNKVLSCDPQVTNDPDPSQGGG